VRPAQFRLCVLTLFDLKTCYPIALCQGDTHVKSVLCY
jgi:hypothetical protein